MTFRTGDRVTITDPAPERAAYRGKTGTVVDDGSKSGGLIAVKGLDGRLKEAVAGYHGFYADELKAA
jgi:ribosomal protein L21E